MNTACGGSISGLEFIDEVSGYAAALASAALNPAAAARRFELRCKLSPFPLRRAAAGFKGQRDRLLKDRGIVHLQDLSHPPGMNAARGRCSRAPPEQRVELPCGPAV